MYLPNQYHSFPDNLSAASVRVITYGIMRSGTTFTWQLLSSIFPNGIIKTHAYCSHNVPCIINVRDFRDTLVSLWRTDHKYKILDSFEEADIFLSKTFNEIEILKRYLNNINICIVKYEEWNQCPSILFSKITDFLQIKVDSIEQETLLQKYSLENNKKISDSIESFHVFDAQTHIHGNHIFNGKVGNWKETTTPRIQSYLNENLSSVLWEFGYETF